MHFENIILKSQKDPAAAAAKSLQSCPTMCNPIDGSPPGSSVPGILQARTLEWGAISFSNAWKWKVKVKSLSHVRLLVTPWTAAYQALPSMGFSRQEYWSGMPLPSPKRVQGTKKKRKNSKTLWTWKDQTLGMHESLVLQEIIPWRFLIGFQIAVCCPTFQLPDGNPPALPVDVLN